MTVKSNIPPPKRRDIAAALRSEIVSGRLKPGVQLPSRAALITRFGSTAATVQHAMDILLREGFIRVNGRQATYVSDHPPHLYEYAMVFASVPEQKSWNRFFRMLATAAEHYRGTTEEPRRIRIHYGVDAHVDNREGRLLSAAARTRSLAGLIFPENPAGTGLSTAPFCMLPGVPRVAFAAAPMVSGGATWGSIALKAFHNKALDELKRQGCRRIAVLYGHPSTAGAVERYSLAIAERGLTTHPYWLLTAPYQGPQCARQLIHLLLHAGQQERPDGLLIADDNLVEEALAGVVEAGIRVPAELRIVTHCNLPWPLASPLPVCRIGFASATLVAACLDELDAQRHGAAPSTCIVAPVFEHEL